MIEKELIDKDLQEHAEVQKQEYLKNLELYYWLKDKGYIIYEVITGSMAHGTSTPKSDIDKAFVYILPEDDILGIRYKEQLKIHKDYMGYEIRRFLELLRKNNPTILELLNSPEDCIITKHPAFDILINQRDKFITKICRDSFYGYAKQQIVKAKGLDKKQNWSKNRVTRKTPIDFCYVLDGYDSIPLASWLGNRKLDQKFCGLSAVNHCRDNFAVFYDENAHNAFSELVPEDERVYFKEQKKLRGETMGFGYKGIAFEDSNDLRRSTIPKEEQEGSICHISYNKDGYNKHCIDFKSYQTWLSEKNEQRWVDFDAHGQKYDGKNLMHCTRLITIGKEIAQGKGVQIRRPDASELLKIRRGEVSLEELINKSESLLNEMKMLYDNSSLPNEVSEDFVHNILVKIRKRFYNFDESKELESSFDGYLHQNVKNSDLIKFSETIDNEATNIFFVKQFGNLSELQYVIVQSINKWIVDECEGDFDSFVNSGIYPWLKMIKNWPKTIVESTGKTENADTGNFSIIEMTRDKVHVMCGGNWQKPIQFDVVVHGDDLAAINIQAVNEWNHGMPENLFLTKLGYTLTYGCSSDETN